MFTGIIQSLGTVVELAPHHLVLDAPGIDEPLGASVAVDGCCLTVVERSPSPTDAAPWPGAPAASTLRLRFDVLPHTIEHTRLASLAPGSVVNLEAAVRAGAPLGGHLVQGHVDGVAAVAASERDAQGRWLDLSVELPQDLAPFCMERGSITVNGTSLTVMGVAGRVVQLQLIPETQQRTNLGELAVGDLVNVEADVIARYVDHLLRRNR